MGASGGDIAVRRRVVHGARHAAALGMHQELGIGILPPLGLHVGRAERRVHVALPHPHLDGAPRHAAHMASQEEVRHEQHRHVGRQCLDDRHRVARGAAVVGLGLHRGAAVHVGDDHAIGMGGAPRAHVLRLDRGRERAPGIRVGDEHALVGVGDGSRLGHEMHAADDEQRRIELAGASRHPQRVRDHVRHVLDLGSLVVVGQNRGPPLGLERPDFGREVRHDTHPLVEEPPRGGRLGNASVHRRGWTAPGRGRERPCAM